MRPFEVQRTGEKEKNVCNVNTVSCVNDVFVTRLGGTSTKSHLRQQQQHLFVSFCRSKDALSHKPSVIRLLTLKLIRKLQSWKEYRH